jgi:hypothetical protein
VFEEGEIVVAVGEDADFHRGQGLGVREKARREAQPP